jgi:hypothetical protein
VHVEFESKGLKPGAFRLRVDCVQLVVQPHRGSVKGGGASRDVDGVAAGGATGVNGGGALGVDGVAAG